MYHRVSPILPSGSPAQGAAPASPNPSAPEALGLPGGASDIGVWPYQPISDESSKVIVGCWVEKYGANKKHHKLSLLPSRKLVLPSSKSWASPSTHLGEKHIPIIRIYFEFLSPFSPFSPHLSAAPAGRPPWLHQSCYGAAAGSVEAVPPLRPPGETPRRSRAQKELKRK